MDRVDDTRTTKKVCPLTGCDCSFCSFPTDITWRGKRRSRQGVGGHKINELLLEGNGEEEPERDREMESHSWGSLVALTGRVVKGGG